MINFKIKQTKREVIDVRKVISGMEDICFYDTKTNDHKHSDLNNSAVQTRKNSKQIEENNDNKSIKFKDQEKEELIQQNYDSNNIDRIQRIQNKFQKRNAIQPIQIVKFQTISESQISQKIQSINQIDQIKCEDCQEQESIKISNKEDVPQFKSINIDIIGKKQENNQENEQILASKAIQECLKIKKKYQILPYQKDYKKIKDFLIQNKFFLYNLRNQDVNEPIIDLNLVQNIELPQDLPDELFEQDGVFSVFNEDQFQNKYKEIPNIVQFIQDFTFVLNQCNSKSNNSYAMNRIQLLQSKFKIHKSQNSQNENRELIDTQCRDFYNVRKVDCSLYFKFAVTIVTLKEFIKQKIRILIYIRKKSIILQIKINKRQNKFVISQISIQNLQLGNLQDQIKKLMQKNIKSLNIIISDQQNDINKIFLEYDNFINGRYLAELTKIQFQHLENNKYIFTEQKLDIYGKNCNEWQILSDWILNYKLQSHQNRWNICLHGSYESLKQDNKIKSFFDYLVNIFQPLFAATIYPNKQPNIYRFLLTVRGFSFISDERKLENLTLKQLVQSPEDWTQAKNPPYVYYLYYIFANIQELNKIRAKLGLNTFKFRPDCGQHGKVDHLVSAFLLTDQISQGLTLIQNPFTNYIYYLSQMAISVSPLCTKKQFLQYIDHPFNFYFQIGMNISLCTQTPLTQHLTNEPLLEEYACASQVLQLSNVDLSEICSKSVLQSGFEHLVKSHWLGQNYHDPSDVTKKINQQKTNISQIRLFFRNQCYEDEQQEIKRLANFKI